jgi:hypothetical protein
MATAAQINANRQNAQKSSGPTSKTGKQASSKNRMIHGLSHHNASSYFLDDEDPDKFAELWDSLSADYQPQSETERILVKRMADHEWLRTRALRYQHHCFFEDSHVMSPEHLALYIRYQTTHERAFYKALNELQKLRKETKNEQIGFESQKSAAEAHDLKKEAQNLKQQQFELKKQEFEWKKHRATTASSPNIPVPHPETSPADLEMAA